MSAHRRMEPCKPISAARCFALIAAAGLLTPLAIAQSPGVLSQKETNRRAVAIQEAQLLLTKGDEAYNAARYGDAVEAYSGAYDLIPSATVAAELKAATAERLAQASVEQGRVLVHKGDLAGAKALVDKALVIAPQHAGATQYRAQLDDPIRTNPALTKEHVQDIDEVRRLLYRAQGAYDLGKFQEAKERYEEALRIDPYNTAARRGIEEATVAKSNYQKAAYDNTRAQMLADVDKEWEQQITPLPTDFIVPDAPVTGEAGFVPVKAKIERIILPQVALEQASLSEAVDFLRARIAEVDPNASVNFTINLGASDSPESKRVSKIRFDLRVKNVPVSQILKYITDATRTAWSTDDFSVIIRPLNSSSTEMITRSFRVPPDFLSSLSDGAAADGGASSDPFAQDAPKGGLLPQRLSAQEALAKQGITFPEGASATFLAVNNTLRVVNTEANLDMITQLVDSVAKTEPVVVKVEVTMIKVQESRLEELGFDWILDNFGFGGPSWVPGNAKYTLTGGTQGNGGDLGDIALPVGSSTRNPITAGNRSGDEAVLNDSIDSVLVQNQDSRQRSSRAPGVISLRGMVSNATVQVLMRGLNQKKGVDMMGRPSVLSRSGQSSSVKFVREMKYPTEYEPPELPNQTGGFNINPLTGLPTGGGGGGGNAVTPATPTAFEVREIGVNLEVLPVVDPSKQFVNLTLSPVFTDFDGFVNYGSPITTTADGLLGPTQVDLTQNAILMPIFSKQAVTTSVDVADGATVVLGGLRKEQVQNVEDKTPILGDLPIVGRLFQSKVYQPISTAIVFLVHVEVMDPTGRSYRDR